MGNFSERVQPCSPPPPHYSTAPSNYSASPTAWATCSQYTTQNRWSRRTHRPTGGNYGLTDLTDRGLGCALLVVSDGARGVIAAIEQVFPTALRQRCLIHRLRNALAKIPAGMQPEIRDGYWAVFDTADLKTEPGPRLVELIDARLGAFAARYAPTYPAAMKILLTDRAGLTAYLRFPAEHHHRIRHSNFIERTFGETRRRAKVIGRFPGETSCISIAWAVLDRASRGWRGLTMTAAGLRQLQDLRRSLLQPPQQLRPRHTPDSTSSTTEAVIATA